MYITFGRFATGKGVCQGRGKGNSVCVTGQLRLKQWTEIGIGGEEIIDHDASGGGGQQLPSTRGGNGGSDGDT